MTSEHNQATSNEAEKWFTDYMRTNPMAQRPLPTPVPELIPPIPQSTKQLLVNKPLVDKICKYGDKECRVYNFFVERRGISMVEYLDSSGIEGSCKLGFFQTEFKKKYVSQQYLDKKRKEFLELKQGDKMEFVRLSKYAEECIPSEAVMCTQFEEGLNEDIQLLVGILELKESIVLVNRLQKAEELSKSKKKADLEVRDSIKRQLREIEGSKIVSNVVGNILESFVKRKGNAPYKGLPPKNSGRVVNRSGTKDTTVRSEARALVRAYAIRAREDTFAPDVKLSPEDLRLQLSG
ncbi:E3 ubiquitin-protein ligase RBBP6 [Gossypium australe]|uniref:E3 ubiquitin-protein ligase RBBP6 n=1 Tax=Gossypium australe TaxID=47621 RepID=A0A5B6VLH7_9ROSI|nr:E3 ubiquitin-protein ligase RBBP6 [Gossypium australe]